MADYQLPSSFVGGMQGASNALSAGKLPQGVQSPILKQILPTPKPVPVDPNKSPEVFKKRFIEKHGDGVAEDGRKYSAIPAPEIVAKVIRKYGDGNTTDGIPYREFLPRPASPNDSLEYRLKQIESLSQTPKSQFYTTGGVRGQTTGEKQFTTQVTNREKENEFVKTVKAPYRAVYNAMETPSQGLQMAVSDALNLIGADETSKNLTKQLVKDKFEQDTLNKDNKGLVGGIQEGSPSSIIGSLVTAIPNLLLYANPVGATTGIISTGGGLSLEGEAQGQTGAGDKAIAYSAGTISGLIDKISGQKFIDGLLSKGIKKEVAQGFVTKTKNFLKTLKPSDFEAGTEVIQQKIENWGRQLMGTEYDKGWKQYAEAGLMGKILGKVGDKGFSESPVTVLPPAPPAPSRVDTKNIETLQTIKIGKRANANVERNKSRGFDSYSDIATHQEIVPTVDKTGLVKTTEQVQNLEDTLDPINDALTQSIKDEGVLIPLDEFLIDSMNEAKQYENEGASYDRYVNQIRKDFEVYKRFTDAQGRIDLSKINEIKKAKYGISNFSDVESDKANKMVGKAAKELVEKYTKGESTKAINRELARWYSARDLLLAMDGKTVKGGRLGKMAARVGGNIIGSYFGPLGSFAGGEISAAVQGQMMKGSLKTPKGNIDSGDILSKIPKRTTPQLPPASQSSADKKVVLPVQSRPVSESVLPSQKLTVLSKKEVSGKKVNNSIIQKLKEKKTKNSIIDRIKEKKTEVKANLPKTPMKTEKTSETLLNEYDSIKKEIDSLRENAMKKIKNGEDTGDLIPRIKELQTKEESIYNEYKSKRNIEEGLDESNRKIESDKVIEDKKITEMKKSEETDLRGFTDNMSPMEKGKAISLLTNKRVMYKGKAMTLRDAFEKKLEDGWKLSDNGLIFRNPEYLSHTVDVGTPVNKTESAYIKYISKSDTPKTPQVEGKTVDAQQISDKIQNSFVNNPGDKLDKADRLQGKGYSYKEATTGLSETGKDVSGRIEIGRNGKGELEILDGRHLLEAYREKGIKIPNDKIKFRDGVTMQDLTKKKSSLPLSQKSEVKYDLASEAKKYKTEAEFIDSLKKKMSSSILPDDFYPKKYELPKDGGIGRAEALIKSTEERLAQSKKELGMARNKNRIAEIERIIKRQEVELQDKINDLNRYNTEKKAYSDALDKITNKDKVDAVIRNGKATESDRELLTFMLENRDKPVEFWTDIYKQSKPKPSLPLSQKSEVKYSKPDTLVQEAKKYKSAEEFVKAQQKPKSDSVRLYRGMTSKFDKNFDLSKTDAPNGYSTWTDNPELARQYAGDKGHIYQIDLPKKQEGMELLNNDGDRVLFLDNQKKAGLNNVSGKEYLIYNDHDLYNPDLIKEAPTKQQLLDIYNKANKSSLPMSAKSEVKYSKPARMLELEKEIQDYTDKFKGLDQKLGLEEAKKQMMPDGKPNEKYIKARDELLEYRWGEDSKGNVTRKMYSDDTPEQIRENQLWLKNNKQKSALPMSQKTDTIYSKGEKPVKIDAMDIEKHGNNRIIYDKKQYKILEEKDVVEQRKPTKSFGLVSPFNIHYKYKLYKVEDMNGKLFDIKDISEPEVIKIERRTDVPIDEKSYKEGVEFYKKRYGLDVTIAQ